MTICPEDALKYAAARLRQTADWTLGGVVGSMCDGGHDIEMDAIGDVVEEVRELAAQYGDPNRYSDGRVVKTHKEITLGLSTSHVWHPDADLEEPRSWRGKLSSDPGVPSPGSYEVTLYPSTQEIVVRVHRVAEAEVPVDRWIGHYVDDDDADLSPVG